MKNPQYNNNKKKTLTLLHRIIKHSPTNRANLREKKYVLVTTRPPSRDVMQMCCNFSMERRDSSAWVLPLVHPLDSEAVLITSSPYQSIHNGWPTTVEKYRGNTPLPVLGSPRSPCSGGFKGWGCFGGVYM